MLYFVNSFLYIFQKYILILENKNKDITELDEIFRKLRSDTIKRKKYDFYETIH